MGRHPGLPSRLPPSPEVRTALITQLGPIHGGVGWGLQYYHFAEFVIEHHLSASFSHRCSHGQASAPMSRLCKVENQLLLVSLPFLSSGTPNNPGFSVAPPAWRTWFDLAWGEGRGHHSSSVCLPSSWVPKLEPFLHGRAQRHSWKTGTIS